jgi:hypothetical protein
VRVAWQGAASTPRAQASRSSPPRRKEGKPEKAHLAKADRAEMRMNK